MLLQLRQNLKINRKQLYYLVNTIKQNNYTHGKTYTFTKILCKIFYFCTFLLIDFIIIIVVYIFTSTDSIVQIITVLLKTSNYSHFFKCYSCTIATVFNITDFCNRTYVRSLSPNSFKLSFIIIIFLYNPFC